ncbi:hypothetical protein SAMN05216299_11714 [Nitrosospira sp. Nsp14]|nr:hypothetical protein SAMN05216299_11714 [Nitrosospira sp. Nsp14]
MWERRGCSGSRQVTIPELILRVQRPALIKFLYERMQGARDQARSCLLARECGDDLDCALGFDCYAFRRTVLMAGGRPAMFSSDVEAGCRALRTVGFVVTQT